MSSEQLRQELTQRVLRDLEQVRELLINAEGSERQVLQKINKALLEQYTELTSPAP